MRQANRPSRRRWTVIGLVLLPALLADVGLVWGIASLLDALSPDPVERRARPVRLVIREPPKEEPEPEEEEPEFTGQIVEVAPPEVEEIPEESDYLAEHNQVVEEETMTKKFKVNPEVLSQKFSLEEQLETEDLVDLNIEEKSTGATVGNDRFDPDRDGTLANLPSPWAVTNKEGVQDPTRASHANASVAGSPQNDLLDERMSDRVRLNTKEYLYATYMKRIRRLVNFYWNQNLDNLPRSMRLSKSKYFTRVDVVLDSSGALEMLEVSESCGSAKLDQAVVSAFRLAGPFPNPPEGLISKDGRVYLPDFGFNVSIGAARANYRGVDPRAGVEFPGILKSPR